MTPERLTTTYSHWVISICTEVTRQSDSCRHMENYNWKLTSMSHKADSQLRKAARFAFENYNNHGLDSYTVCIYLVKTGTQKQIV